MQIKIIYSDTAQNAERDINVFIKQGYELVGHVMPVYVEYQGMKIIATMRKVVVH